MEFDFSDQFIDNRSKGGIFGWKIRAEAAFLYSMIDWFQEKYDSSNGKTWSAVAPPESMAANRENKPQFTIIVKRRSTRLKLKKP